MILFSKMEGWTILTIYGIISLLITIYFNKKSKNPIDFLVGNRSLPLNQSALSIAASWIWAPALFVASQQAYINGLAGLFWFTIPNIACLVIFAYFAGAIRKRYPEGFSLSGYMRKTYSKRVQMVYGVELVSLSICSFAVQLLAGGLVISTITEINFFHVTLMLSFIALSYSMWSGIKASVITDSIQMIIIVIVTILTTSMIFTKVDGFATIVNGIGGINNKGTNIFDSTLLMTFGIPTTIGLLAGPFGDQSFWQRAFSTKEADVKSAFVRGALLFSIVPILMGILGFLAAGTEYTANDMSLVNLEMVIKYLPMWITIPFILMLLSGLISTLDSCLCAVSSIIGSDVGEQGQVSINIARASMIVLAFIAILISNIPGMQIIYLFLFYGTLRASTFLPTVLTLITNKKLNEKGVFWGIIASITLGLPIFTYYTFEGNPIGTVIGSLITVLLSGVLTYIMSTKLVQNNFNGFAEIFKLW